VDLLLCDFSAGAGGVGSKIKSRWQPIVPTADHTTVTLDDVKSVCHLAVSRNYKSF